MTKPRRDIDYQALGERYKKLYDKGMGIQRIATMEGDNFSTVRKSLLFVGVTLRPRSRNGPPEENKGYNPTLFKPERGTPEDQLKLIRKKYEQEGWSTRALARHWEVSSTTMRVWLKMAGATMRGKGGSRKRSGK